MYKQKRIGKWSADKLSDLSDEDFISIFLLVVEDRTNLKVGDLVIENRIQKGAPPDAQEFCLREAERRKIPLSVIAEKLVQKAISGKSFISNLVAPSGWKDFEIKASEAILLWIQRDGIILDKIDYDARVIGKVTKTLRQVDLRLITLDPPYTVAIECKDYVSGSVTVDKIEAFQTKLTDIAANKGVYITKMGYQKSAITTAEYYNITLLTFDIVDKNNPPRDLNKNHLLDLRSSKNAIWCLRHMDSAWYFGRTSNNAHNKL